MQVSVGSSHSASQSSEDQTIQRESSVQAGGTATFVATGNGTPDNGNLTIAGSNVSANDVVLAAKNQVNIVNTTNTDVTQSSNASSGSSVGVSFTTAGPGVSASMQNAHGDGNSSAAIQNASHVSGANSMTVVSGGDTNILGSQVGGGKVVASVGGDLTIQSVQDTTVSSAHQSSASGGIGVSTVGGGASFSAQNGHRDGTYANVNEQAGIQAGAGGYDISVAGDTGLTVAVIASTADASKNSLTTGTLTSSDIQNQSHYDATSNGLIAGGSIRYSGKAVGPSSVSGSGGIVPMMSQNDSGNQSGTTRSAIGAGTISLINQAAQTQDVASLSRETSGANGTVSATPDVSSLLSQQADTMNAAQAAGQTVAQGIGAYADAKQKNAKTQAEADAWAEGGTDRALLHAAGGALVSGLGGGNAIGAGVSSKLAGGLNALTNSVASDTGSTLLGNIASNVLAGAAGALVGGSSGAFAAANADLYNRQLNHTEKQAIADKAAGDTAEQTKLTQAACYAVQCWAQYSPNSDEYAEHYVSPQQAAQLAPELQWVQSQSASKGLFNYTLTDQVIDGGSSQLDSARRAAENLGNQFAAAIRQNAGRSSSSDIDPLTSAMDGGEPPSGTAGAVVTLPMVTCIPPECVLSPSIALPGAAGYVPSNAILNGGNGEQGSKGDARTNSVSDFQSAADQPFNDSGLSAAARAWDKHAGRAGGTFEPLTGSIADKNAAASEFVNQVLNDPATTRTELSRGGVEFRQPNGQGIRFNADGSFSGVLDPRK